jgi:hypothetical protein
MNKIRGRTGLIASLSLALAACGGGGGGGSSSGGGGNPQLNTLSWSTPQRLGTDTNQLPPAPSAQPLGGEPTDSLWLRLSGGVTSLWRSQASGSARGLASTSLQSGLPAPASSNATVAVVAGDHSMVVWTETPGNTTSADGAGLYAQVSGPGGDTGPRQISGTYSGDARDTVPVIDASGNARIFWDESGQPGLNKQLFNANWVSHTATGLSLTALVPRRLSGPDGQGWVMFGQDALGTVQHQARPLSAANGLGGSARLDDPSGNWQILSRLRLASPEGQNGFTTVGLQYPPGNPEGSFVIRRASNGLVQNSTLTLAAPGAAQPNGNYQALATSAGGQALLVWSTGTDNTDLYVARRSASGVWGSASLLMALPAPINGTSMLAGLNAVMGPDGQAMVSYLARDDLNTPLRLHAMATTDGTAWPTTATPLTYSGYSIQSVLQAVTAYNAAGTPGVLQVVNTTAQSNFYPVTVLMSTWANGSWRSVPLTTNVELPYFGTTLVGQIRLAPQGGEGWLAQWDQGNGPGDTLAYRELWASEFR